MGIFKGTKRQLRSVIEWKNPSRDLIFSKWSENGDEIKNASKLLVNPGQGCIFVYQGEIKAIFEKEGLFDLSTDNIPFWTTITKVMQSFESEHKVGIYFYRKVQFLDQKWGTPKLIKYLDPIYKFPVALRAHGNYSFKITDPKAFFVNIVGSEDSYRVSDFRNVMGNRIIEPLSDYFAESGFTYTEIDAQREELSEGIEEKLKPEFKDLGFEITDFRIEGTSFDEDTMKRINRIADMTAEAQAAKQVGLNYAQMQQVDAMRDAAQNEGGAAGMGMGMGAGIGFGNMMANTMGKDLSGVQNNNSNAQNNQNAQEDPMAKLKQLKQLFENELITEEEYKEKKQEVLSKL